MQNLGGLLSLIAIASAITLTGCVDSEAMRPSATGPGNTDPTESSPVEEGDQLAGFCSQMKVDFAESPLGRSTQVPGVLQHLVKSNSDTHLSSFSQVNLASRSPSMQSSDVIPRGQGFTTIHGNVINTDQVDLIVPGNLQLEWIVENNLYQPEGVTSGELGYYGTHVFPTVGTDTDFSMIALDKNSGARNWVVRPGQIGQGGTPLLLNDPETGSKVVYSGGLRGVFALDEHGQTLWCTNTRLGIDSSAISDFDTHIKKRLWGLNYHEPTDSIIAVYGDGTVMAFSRTTGQLRAKTRIDGDPSVVSTGVVLPAPILEGAETAFRRQFVPPGAEIPEEARIFDTVVAVALGGNMVVSNYYATDPDSDRIWIAATLPDAADGKEDGAAEFGALHAINLTKSGENYTFKNECTVPFEGGSASTPAVLPGGDRIYTSDNAGNALAFDKNCNLIWSVDVGDQILGSLTVSPYDNYLYAASGSGVFQIIDNGSTGQLGWSAQLDDIFHGGPLLLPVLQTLVDAFDRLGLATPVQLQASNIEIATVSENALLLMGGLGIQFDPDRSEVFGPLVMTITTVDRMTGAIINSTPAREESIAVMGVDDEGSVIIGNSPLRRGAVVGISEILGNGALGEALREIIPPLTGGVTKYSPMSNQDSAARDAVCYAARKALVWEVHGSKANYSWSQAPESVSYDALTQQAKHLLSQALKNGLLTTPEYSQAMFAIADASLSIEKGNYRLAHSILNDACQRLH